ncbi:hypothetical protein DFP72DRAFT_855339 [Ephemerocybe angulata]|uniref:Uncharacterized protein n=1 Tax=Ephemerocybe angulata TaxID=980116 RepID=A0A8H6HIK0_9AGAR|nr:hypothetical protein DFP72DRAFT_855339 [Tulosesus angulatus]
MKIPSDRAYVLNARGAMVHNGAADPGWPKWPAHDPTGVLCEVSWSPINLSANGDPIAWLRLPRSTGRRVRISDITKYYRYGTIAGSDVTQMSCLCQSRLITLRLELMSHSSAMQLTSILSIFSVILAFAATQTIEENIMDLGDNDIHARALNLDKRDLMEDEFGTLYRASCGPPGLCFCITGKVAPPSWPLRRAKRRLLHIHRREVHLRGLQRGAELLINSMCGGRFQPSYMSSYALETVQNTAICDGHPSVPADHRSSRPSRNAMGLTVQRSNVQENMRVDWRWYLDTMLECCI